MITLPRSLFAFAAVCLWSLANGFAEPTETRQWQSLAGTSILAKALSIHNETVLLETPEGRTIQVKLSQLSEADRGYLTGHFGSSSASAAELPYPLGQTSGPVTTGESSYYVYLPKSLKAERQSPLLFFTNSGGGDRGTLQGLIDGAEVCGWILAVSVESKNKTPEGFNYGHSKRCVDHLLATLPIDPERVYFSGSSGGSRTAFTNSSKMKSAGVIGIIAGGQRDEINRKKHYFYINGATDYNRYGSAVSFSLAEATSAIRFHPGSHDGGPDWMKSDGVVWLESKWHEREKTSGPQRADFEQSAIAWMEKLEASQPHRAAWWAYHLTAIGLSGEAKSRAEKVIRTIGTDPDAIAYAKGIADIEKFASDTLAKGPVYSPECFKHTSPAIQKRVEKLLESYADTPWIGEILVQMKEPTGG